MQPKGGTSLGRVRLRTLVYIRWIAVLGQLFTLLIVHFGLGFKLPLLAALVVIGASAGLNMFLVMTQPLRQFLPDRAAAIFLAYDVVQLSALLYLCGGLENPFAILILAPVTVSATVLSRDNTIGLGILAAICITILAFLHEPLPWENGGSLKIDDLYVMGIWQAIAISILFIAAYVGSVAGEARVMNEALTATQMALSREQQLTELGALAAAAAHELGSPLATITVVAHEMGKEVPADSPLREDVDLLIEQTVRCREILAELGRKHDTSAGEAYTHLPVSTMVSEAARPHQARGIRVTTDAAPAADTSGPEPEVQRTPEFMHGVGTLIQNAIQFARNEVILRTRWSNSNVTVEIIDDGPGFSPHLLDRLGEPYVSTRATGKGEGEHMGLGIFIAQTLLNRTGAVLAFENQDWWDWWGAGAIVRITWPRSAFERENPEAEQ